MDIDAGPFLLTAGVPPGRVGDLLSQARGRVGLSRPQLASRLGVSRWWVRRWEHGTHRVPDPVIRRAITELGLSLEELVPQRLPVQVGPSGTSLLLGDASVPLDAGAGNAGVLAAYVELVAQTRVLAPAGPWELRVDDLAVLTELLDLEADDLEGHLRRAFGLTSDEAVALRARMRRQRVLVAAAVAVGAFGSAPGAQASDDLAVGGDNVVHVAEWRSTTAAPAATDEVEGPGPVASVTPIVPTAAPAPAPAPVVLAEPAPAVVTSLPTARPAPAATAAVPDEDVVVEIADAVTIERDAVVVDIGDALTIERDDAEADPA